MPIVEMTTETETFALKSAPPDGFVTLKRMSHGQQLKRRDGAGVMSARASVGLPDEVFVNTHQEWMRYYDFKLCIVDHNLQKNDGSKLDFSQKSAFDLLPPAIGMEIEELIDKLNGFDIVFGEDDERPLGSPAIESSQDETNPTEG